MVHLKLEINYFVVVDISPFVYLILCIISLSFEIVIFLCFIFHSLQLPIYRLKWEINQLID